MEHYERLVKIGEGASGVVYKARDRRMGDTVAIKRLRAGGGNGVGEDGAALEAAFRREVRCLDACHGHPSLVALRAAHLDPYTGGAFLVMDYAGRSLADVMRDDGRAGKPFGEPEARRVMRVLLEGAAAMHARGVLHRDLKPANVLLDAHGGARICDFGLSRPDTAQAGTSPLTPGVSTLWYRAPELILGSRDYDLGVDTWALGCVMAELLAGGAPLFPGRSEMDQLNRIFDTLGAQDDALRCPWFDDEVPVPVAAGAHEALAAPAVDQTRASSSCSAGFSAAAGGVTVHGVAAEALVA